MGFHKSRPPRHPHLFICVVTVLPLLLLLAANAVWVVVATNVSPTISVTAIKTATIVRFLVFVSYVVHIISLPTITMLSVYLT